jgi:hypothetical protein
MADGLLERLLIVTPNPRTQHLIQWTIDEEKTLTAGVISQVRKEVERRCRG